MTGATFGHTVWLRMKDAASYVGRPSAKAFRQFARRAGIPLYRIGGQLVVDARDLDSWIRSKRVA